MYEWYVPSSFNRSTAIGYDVNWDNEQTVPLQIKFSYTVPKPGKLLLPES